jgi:hypothetical protein
MWKIAQSNITVNMSKYIESVRERIDSYIDFSYAEYERLQGFQFNPDSVISAFESAGYPNIDAFKQFFQTKDLDQLHNAMTDVFAWWKQKKDTKIWQILSPALKALNDYETVSEGNQIVWTEEFGRKRLEEVAARAQQTMEKIHKNIAEAISRIPQWNNSPIQIIANELYKDNDIDSEPDATIKVGAATEWDMTPNFTYFVLENGSVEIEDVLEGGDTDFFTDNNIQADYFNLVNALRNPNAFTQAKVVSLYTARPSKDRDRYMNAKTVPSNIFLTTKYDFAYGFAQEYGGERDVWKVRILDRYLVKTMDSVDQKQYQTIGKEEVPIASIELITPWEYIKGKI